MREESVAPTLILAFFIPLSLFEGCAFEGYMFLKASGFIVSPQKARTFSNLFSIKTNKTYINRELFVLV
jgi:hypothetical protein